MTTPPPPGAAPGAGAGRNGPGGSLISRLGGNRNAAILAAGATVGLVALIASWRGRNTPTATTVMNADEFDSGPYDMWNAWQQQYEDLQSQINDLNDGSSNPATPSKPLIPVTLPAPIAKPPIPTPAPKPAKPKPRPAPVHKTVTVKRGDTLSAIAAKNKISMATLKKLNPKFWTDPKYKQGNMIWAGTKVAVS